jgi:aspartyl-tRNA(Asn)/glutamyl-tRNA(Gln) amidotransferase subunit B
MTKIGLEIHVQLSTESKLFCSCPNRFVREPNTYVCEICLGMPGSKPSVNAKAVEYATKIGLALDCKFSSKMFFSRKSYFYPDMSKNYQITQFEMPIATNGSLAIGDKSINIRRIQIEEDPARITHAGTITDAKYVLVDYNRSGTPLVEIVTEPDFTTPEETKKFLDLLASMLEYLGVYDSSLEGSMRVDANISIPGENRVEIKNISGGKDVEKALSYEVIRQKDLVRRGQKVARETRGWDEASGVTRSLRSKEEEEEYGYIFDTDLPVINLAKEKIESIKSALPEFAAKKIARYVQEFGITKEQAEGIASQPDLAASYEEVSKYVDPKLAADFFIKGVLKTLNYHNLRLKQTRIIAEHITKLLQLVDRKDMTIRAAELMFRDIILRPQDPTMLFKMQGISRIADEKQLEQMVENVMSENAKAVVDFRSGHAEALQFLLGQLMRTSKGRADPSIARKILEKRLMRG